MAVLLPGGVETYLHCQCTRNRHAYGLCLAPSKMVRLNAPKSSAKTAIIHSSPRGDRETMHASSACNIP